MTACGDGRERLIGMIESSLLKGHEKVAAQRIMMLLYGYGSAPPAYIDLLNAVEGRCRRFEVARIRRSGFQWAQLVRAADTAGGERSC